MLTAVIASLAFSFFGEELYREARLAHLDGHYTQAMEGYNAVMSNGGPFAEYASVRLADCLVAVEDFDAAESLYGDVIASPNTGPWTRLAQAQLATMLNAQGRYAEAHDVYMRVLDVPVSPWWFDKVEWRGWENATRVPGQEDRAYDYFEQILTQSIYIKKRQDAARILARSPLVDDLLLAAIGLVREDMRDQGQAVLRRLWPMVQDDDLERRHFAFVNGALALDATKDLPRDFNLKLQPDRAWARMAMLHRVSWYGSLGRFDDSEAVCDAMVNAWPDAHETVEGVYRHAHCLRKKNQRREAAEAYLRVAEVATDHRRTDDALLWAAEMYEELGETDRAVMAYEQLAAIVPDSRDASWAQYRLVELLKGDANPDGMIAALEQGATGPLGHYHTHRLASRMAHYTPPSERPNISLPMESLNGLVAPQRLVVPDLPAIPEEIAQDMRFFGELGFEEGEWEALHLYTEQPKGPWSDMFYEILARTGFAHTATEFMNHSGWGIRDGRSTPERERIYYARVHWDHVSALGRETGVDPFLILAVGRQESTFRPALTSWAGAAGLMQVMPSTARWMAEVDHAISLEDVERLNDPIKSLRLGAHYLRRMLSMWDGNVVYALASYNAGPGNVQKWLRTYGDLPLDEFIEAVPFSETKNYLKRVLGNYAAYHSLYPSERMGQDEDGVDMALRAGTGVGDE